MSFGPREYLAHVRDEAEYLAQRASGLTREHYLSDDTLRRAFVRSLEVIGEAVKHLPSAVTNRESDVPWRAIAGMRDRLIHGYFGVDHEIVWNVVQVQAPILLAAVNRLLAELDAPK
jgi:uncharacterized protein with HEPN domain